MAVQDPDVNNPQSGTQPGLIEASGDRILNGLFRGVVGGLIATVLMTLYRFPVFRALPPTADFWAKYVQGGKPESYFGVGLVLHFLYGGVAGGLFGVGVSLLNFRSERERSLGTIGLAFAYGLGLSTFGTRVVFQYLLDEDPDPAEVVIFHVGHIIYGLTLGTWLNSQERSGEVYE